MEHIRKSMNDIFQTAKKAIKIGVTIASDNIKVTSPKPRTEILLPSQAGLWDDQIMVDVSDIRTIRTKEDFDYHLILGMYSGNEITITYSFASKMKKDLNKIMDMRSRPIRRSTTGFYFEF